jgi:hypothetical protein
MLRYHVNVKDEILSSEIAMTTMEVCPICGKPSASSTGLCLEHFNEFMTVQESFDTLDSFINYSKSIILSFSKCFI